MQTGRKSACSMRRCEVSRAVLIFDCLRTDPANAAFCGTTVILFSPLVSGLRDMYRDDTEENQKLRTKAALGCVDAERMADTMQCSTSLRAEKCVRKAHLCLSFMSRPKRFIVERDDKRDMRRAAEGAVGMLGTDHGSYRSPANSFTCVGDGDA